MTTVPKIEAFIEAVTRIPAKGFNPIVPAKSVKMEVENDNLIVAFVLEQDVQVRANLIYAWIPVAYKCDSIAFSEGVMTLGIRRR